MERINYRQKPTINDVQIIFFFNPLQSLLKFNLLIPGPGPSPEGGILAEDAVDFLTNKT